MNALTMNFLDARHLAPPFDLPERGPSWPIGLRALADDFDWLPAEPFMQPAPVGSRDYVTIVRTKEACGKHVELGADGKPVWVSYGDVIEGEAITAYVPDAEAMATLLRLMPPNHYLIPDFIAEAGRGPFEVMAQKRINKALKMPKEHRPVGPHTLPGHDLPVWAKLKENFTPGSWKPFDCDRDEHTPDGLRQLRVHEAIARLEEALPGLKGCAKVVALSSKGRVRMDDKPVAASPNFHAWVQVADPDRVDAFRPRLLTRLAAAGLGWLKPRGDKWGPAALVDTSVWAISRCVYVGAPDVGKGLSLAPAAVLVSEGTRFALSSLPEPTDAEKAAARDALGVEYDGGGSGGGANFRDTTGQLTADTVLEVKGHKPMTLADFMANDAFKPRLKYRCQTPFRASTSWNGILHKYENGRATLYDNGTGVLYEWPDPLAGFDKVGGDAPQGEEGAGAQAEGGGQNEGEEAAKRHGYGGGEFVVRPKKGVYFIGPPDDKGDRPPPLWICSPLHVRAKTRDARSGAWGRLLEWRDDDRVIHQWPMPMDLLQGDGADMRRELAALGLAIAPGRKARELLVAYLHVWPVDDRARCVERLGWHGAVYVTPGESVGENGEIVVFQNAHAIEPAFSVAGTVEEWRDTVGRLAAGNSRVAFALSAAFAAPLAEVVGSESGGFHFRGPSSKGKTTATDAAASVWGRPDAYRRAWRTTANGLEGMAALHNDGLLVLDELSQIDPREAGEAAYMLANGTGKARASRTGAARQPARWRLLYLSSGEESLTALMQRVGRKPNAGQEVRLAEIDADAGVGFGIFEALHDQPDSATLALALKDAAAKYHGAVGLAWLRRIVADRAAIANRIAEGIRDFVAEAVPTGADGQVERVARRFGLVAVAGELASEYGLTGWAKGEATAAARKCFTVWLEGFGSIGKREDRALFAQVRGFFEAHGASRFERLDGSVVMKADDGGEDSPISDGRPVHNRAGFVRTGADGGQEFLVLPEAFRTEVCKGFYPKTAANTLVDAGWIERGKDKDHITQQVRTPLGKIWVYVFTSLMWASDE